MELFNIYSPTGEEDETRNYIVNELTKMEIPFNIDTIGNVYSLFHPNKPLLSAHMDTVQRYPPLLFEEEKHLIVEEERDGFTFIGSGNKMIIGADDKCGIFAVLKVLEALPQTNFLFSVAEEVGARGAYFFTKTQDMSMVSYGLVLDRHGYYDIVCSKNGYGTAEFEKELVELGKPWGMAPARGIFSDCNALNKQISCANISVGYEGAHTAREWCCVEGINRCISFVTEVVSKLETKFDPPKIKDFDKYFQASFDAAFTKSI